MKKQNWLIQNLNKILSSTVFAIAAIVILRTFVFDWSVVPSGSMSKTFLTGDVVINNKTAYRSYRLCSVPIIGVYFAKKKFMKLPRIKRGDIIVFCGTKDYITKRVVGLPGDIITWDNTDLIINEESAVFNKDRTFIYPTSEDVLEKVHHDLGIKETKQVIVNQILREVGKASKTYVKFPVMQSKNYLPHEKHTYKVPEGTVFIKGDNQNPVESWDSRASNFGTVCMSQITGRVDWILFGSNAKIFNRQRSMISWIIMLPYLILRYLICLDFSRFGGVNRDLVVYPNHSNT